ncbi:MAG: ABC transporter permease [Sphaerobacteraceae bacterium]|nr:MAG: ABC transporter permease [Sphaerobacteraceae bacterium]
MLTYIIRRLLQGMVVILLVTVFTFGLMHLAPGDPIDIMVGEARVTDEQIERIRAQWGLDRPVHEQYFVWLGNAFQGDFGQSVVRRGTDVSEMVTEAAWVTLQLNILAMIVSIGIALPVGMIAAIRRYSTFDYVSMLGATLGVALPNFWVGLMLIFLFAGTFGILPSSGLRTWSAFILPVAVLALEQTALLARMMRSSTIDVMTQDFVNVARAKGLAEFPVIFRHIARNALLPVVTIIGYRLSFILSGTIVVETVFSVPGLGQLFVTSVQRLDYQVMQAIVLLFAVAVVVGNLLTDLTYAYIDPRIRIQ